MHTNFEEAHGFDNSTEDDLTLPGVYLFYAHGENQAKDAAELEPSYSWSIWRPSLMQLWPAGKPSFRIRLRFLFRCALNYLHFFATPEYGALCVFSERKLVHYSGFTPRYWRFPFLADDDLQVGDTWTAPSHRNHGLARFALLQILRLRMKLGRRFWYVVESTNLPSIRVAESAGFTMVAKGSWIRPFGTKLLSSYVMDIDHSGTQSAPASDGTELADLSTRKISA
jgi:RimJ/RimL family protein N-acetyltransferase